MENASKALIIAGAILLSILIIALGIYVFNLARGSMNTNQLSEVEIESFNTPFTQYDGEQNGTQVKSLIDKVVTSNGSNKDAAEKQVTVVYTKNNDKFISKADSENYSGYTEKKVSEIKKEIVNTHTYTVSTVTNSDTGYVQFVEINY